MNYKKLIKDINNGTIDPKSFTLVVDNDDGWLRDELHEDWELAEEREEVLKDTYGRSGGYNDLLEILEVMGINAERC